MVPTTGVAAGRSGSCTAHAAPPPSGVRGLDRIGDARARSPPSTLMRSTTTRSIVSFLSVVGIDVFERDGLTADQQAAEALRRRFSQRHGLRGLDCPGPQTASDGASDLQLRARRSRRLRAPSTRRRRRSAIDRQIEAEQQARAFGQRQQLGRRRLRRSRGSTSWPHWRQMVRPTRA